MDNRDQVGKKSPFRQQHHFLTGERNFEIVKVTVPMSRDLFNKLKMPTDGKQLGWFIVGSLTRLLRRVSGRRWERKLELSPEGFNLNENFRIEQLDC